MSDKRVSQVPSGQHSKATRKERWQSRCGTSIIDLWNGIPKRGRALSHGFCVDCWLASQFTRRIAICVTNCIWEALLHSTPQPLFLFPLRTTSVTACARAACFRRFQR